MYTYTVLPFLVAFMVGLGAMPALNIYSFNAWNIGTARVAPWSTRSNGLTAVANVLRAWASRWCLGYVALGLTLATLAILAHAHPAHAGDLTLALIVAATPRDRREQREKLIRDAGELMGPNFTFETPEKRTAFDALMVDVETVSVACRDDERGERHAELSRTILPESQRQTPQHENEAEQAAADLEVRNRAIGLYLRGVDRGEMSGEERSALTYRAFSPEERRMVASQAAALSGTEHRADNVNTLSGPAGGFLVAPDTRFYGQIIQSMKFFGGMEAAGAEVINTDTAGDLPMAMSDDTGNVGTIVGETKSHAGGVAPTFSELVLHGYLYSSRVVKVSWQMIRDSAVNIEGYVGGLLGERLARAQNAHFTSTGTGSGMPMALTLSAVVGRQSAVGNTTSVPFDDVLRLVHSVDVAYRAPKPSLGFMLHDTSILALRLAKDGNGRYLWPELQNGQQVGVPPTLEGYKYTVNNDMPVMAASAKWMSFGDHSYYKIRRVRGITVVRLNELYAENGQVGFLAYQTCDGGFADPGGHPVKLLQNSAT